MSDRTDLPKIKPDDQPSILNHDAAIGGTVAGALAVIPMTAYVFTKVKNVPLYRMEAESGALIRKIMPIALLAEVAGFVLGGLMGKQKQEREQVDGRVVKDPGYFNKGLLSGWFMGGVAAMPFTWSKAARGESSSLGFLFATAGAVVGSIMRKNSLQRDFDKAVAVRDQQKATFDASVQNVVKAAQPIYKDSVTPQESAVLADKQAAGATTHADKITSAAVEAELEAPVAKR